MTITTKKSRLIYSQCISNPIPAGFEWSDDSWAAAQVSDYGVADEGGEIDQTWKSSVNETKIKNGNCSTATVFEIKAWKR